jgi:hypothetical protein
LLPAAADHPASRHRFSQRAFSIKTPRLPPRPPHLCVSLKQADFSSGKLNVFKERRHSCRFFLISADQDGAISQSPTLPVACLCQKTPISSPSLCADPVAAARSSATRQGPCPR